MRFPRTIRLDDSDEHVFDVAAAPGELAVSGAFAFADLDDGAVKGKPRQAFANGFLGLDSFGRSTLVAVSEISEDGFEEAVRALARHFVDCYGAPDEAAAIPAAREEMEFAAGLCGHPLNTLLTVSRQFGEHGIVERFGTLAPPVNAVPTRVWEIVEGDHGAD